MSRLLILLAMLLPSTLLAHTYTQSGNLELIGASDHSDVKLTVTPDPFWGMGSQENLDRHIETNGELPELTLSGEAVTDAAGDFELKIEFSFSGEGAAPKTQARIGREYKIVEYCSAVIEVDHPAYLVWRNNVTVYPDGEVTDQRIRVQPINGVKGRIVHLSDRSPAANIELQLICYETKAIRHERGKPLEQKTVKKSWAFNTDEEGRFEFASRELARNRYTLTPSGGDLAFASNSLAFRNTYLQLGVKDYGTLTVVAGGSMKFRVKSASSEPLGHVSATIRGANRYELPIPPIDGGGSFTGLFQGEFELHLGAHNHWQTVRRFTVKQGEVADLGEVAIEPWLKADLHALTNDPGGVAEYTVQARMIDEELPHGYNHDDRPLTRQAFLTSERTTMEMLHRGRWSFTVAADGYAPASVEVELPREDPIQVTLQRGGSLKASVIVGEQEQGFELYVIESGSDFYKEAIEYTAEQWRQFRPREDRPGLHRPRDRWNNRNTVEPLVPGKYFVVANAYGFGVITKDDVEVKAGELTEVELTPELPVLKVTVTREGKPAGGVKLHVVLSRDYASLKSYEVTTDEAGLAELELEQHGEVFVATGRVMEYLGGDGQDPWRWRNTLESFSGPALTAGYGEVTEHTIELHDPDRAWVTVDVKAPEDVTLAELYLQRNTEEENPWNRDRRHGRKVGEQWVFPRVSLGDYFVCTELKSAPNKSRTLRRAITVDQPNEQAFEVEFDIRTLKVTVKLPDGVKPRYTHVRMLREEWMNRASSQDLAVGGNVDENGEYTFFTLEAGRYLLVGHAVDQQNRIVATANMMVDTAKSESIDLALSDNIGGMELRVEGTPAVTNPPHRQQRAGSNFRVRFFDDMEEEVYAISPDAGFGAVNQPLRLSGLPSGTYTAVIVAYGLQPTTLKNVVVKKGEITELTVTPLATSILKVEIDGLDSQNLWAVRAQARLLDASGNPVEIQAPGDDVFQLVPDPRMKSLTAHLTNITPEVAKVVISIEGYEDIEIQVDPEPSKTILKKATVKKKAD